MKIAFIVFELESGAQRQFSTQQLASDAYATGRNCIAVRAILGDFTRVELPLVRSVIKTYRTGGFVRLEFPCKMV